MSTFVLVLGRPLSLSDVSVSSLRRLYRELVLATIVLLESASVGVGKMRTISTSDSSSEEVTTWLSGCVLSDCAFVIGEVSGTMSMTKDSVGG